MQGTSLRDQAQNFADADCTVIGISFDTPEDNKTFRAANDFPFPLLSDPDKSIGTEYQVLRDPSEPYADFPQRHSYLIDPQGTIVKAYDVTDPGGHASAVLADLAAAQR